MAELETAAVRAFAQLADELDAHGLDGFADHARAAALDEVRHSNAITRLALTLGYFPAPVTVTPGPGVRSLEEIAVDNASEGCGRELFGAIQNQWQATHASDERVRALMGSVARDELAHANYAFALAAKLNGRLNIAQRRRVAEAQEGMLSQFGENDAGEATRRLLGLMDSEQTARTTHALLEARRLH